MALAIPYNRFSGRFKFSENSEDVRTDIEVQSNNELNKLSVFFNANKEKFIFLNLTAFETDIRQRLYFDSSIPTGSGLGSSGAVSAALYDRYRLIHHDDLQIIKNNLATIEACFHGLSSGIDPFISWIKRAVLIENQYTLNSSVDLSPFLKEYTLYIINSHSTGKTRSLVNGFMEHYYQPEFKRIIDEQYVPTINQTINSLLASDFITFDASVLKYSQLQLTHFQPMINKEMINYFKYGIESREFILKICGSGGGGFILGISNQPLKAEAYFNLNHLDYTVVY